VGCEGALHACIGEVHDYCAVFGLSLRSNNKVQIQIIVISILVLVLLIYTSKQGYTILPLDY